MRYNQSRQSQSSETTARNYTRDLLAAVEAGAKVVGVLPPYVGDEMAYQPRNKHDRWPWVPVSEEYPARRFTGREVRAVTE